jgi:hypothetical protein
MHEHPGRILFQFTRDEVIAVDLTRFNLLFGQLAQVAEPMSRPAMRGLCGAVSLSFDPAIRMVAPSALEHPAFHDFATKLIETMPSIAFLLNLEENSLLLLALGSLSELTQFDHAKTDTVRFEFNHGEFHDKAALLINRAVRWCEIADMEYDEAIARGTAIQEYLSRRELPSNLSW